MGHTGKAGQEGWRCLYRAAVPGGHSTFAQCGGRLDSEGWAPSSV